MYLIKLSLGLFSYLIRNLVTFHMIDVRKKSKKPGGGGYMRKDPFPQNIDIVRY